MQCILSLHALCSRRQQQQQQHRPVAELLTLLLSAVFPATLLALEVPRRLSRAASGLISMLCLCPTGATPPLQAQERMSFNRPAIAGALQQIVRQQGSSMRSCHRSSNAGGAAAWLSYLGGPGVWGCGCVDPFLRGFSFVIGAGAKSASFFTFLSTWAFALTNSACTMRSS